MVQVIHSNNLHFSIISWNLTDLPRNVVVKVDERSGILESHDMDIVRLVKRNAADECLDQEPCSQLGSFDLMPQSEFLHQHHQLFTYYLS